MIIVRNLTKKFTPDREVLSRISFQADEGEFITVLGESGSGKSTLLRCVALKESWDGGQLIYKGRDTQTFNWREKLNMRRFIAYLEEKPQLFPNKTALKNVLGGRLLHMALWRLVTGRVATDDHVLAMDYLEKVGLLDKAHVKAELLSGGEKQRVAMARALVQGARLMVIDEPVSGLDPRTAQQVLQDLKTLCQKHKVTIICSLNQVNWAEKYATRIWGLSEGKLALDIPARSLTFQEKSIIWRD